MKPENTVYIRMDGFSVFSSQTPAEYKRMKRYRELAGGNLTDCKSSLPALINSPVVFVHKSF